MKTLFLPWKRDEVDTTNMALDDRLKVLGMNLVSRLVGAIVRGGAIIIGLLLVIFEFLAEIILVLIFIILPILSVYLIIKSVL